MKRKIIHMAADVATAIGGCLLLLTWIGLSPVLASTTAAGTCSPNAAKSACQNDSCTQNGNECKDTTFRQVVNWPPVTAGDPCSRSNFPGGCFKVALAKHSPFIRKFYGRCYFRFR